MYFNTNLKELNIDEFGGAPWSSDKYPCVVDRDVAASLLSF